MRTTIQYEDKDIIIAYKPAGLATQTSKVGQADMVSELKNYLKSPYLGVVHRLDQPVEGLLVFGKTKEATAALNKQLSQGTLNKQYYAVVCGKPSQKEAKLVDYLYKSPENAAIITDKAKAGEKDAKEAILSYHIIGEKALTEQSTISLVDIHIETGRFHQIRAQMSHAGLPLLGDQKYGTKESTALSKELQVRNVALCAYKLTVKCPMTKKPIEVCVKPQGEIFHHFN